MIGYVFLFAYGHEVAVDKDIFKAPSIRKLVVNK